MNPSAYRLLSRRDSILARQVFGLAGRIHGVSQDIILVKRAADAVRSEGPGRQQGVQPLQLGLDIKVAILGPDTGCRRHPSPTEELGLQVDVHGGRSGSGDYDRILDRTVAQCVSLLHGEIYSDRKRPWIDPEFATQSCHVWVPSRNNFGLWVQDLTKWGCRNFFTLVTKVERQTFYTEMDRNLADP
jgi:hypothetical protein